MHLLRLLTALMLLFGLICGAYCQNRGTAKFNSPQEENSFGIVNENLERESDKSLRSNRVREIDSAANNNAHRKTRYRSKEFEDNDKPNNEHILPRNHKNSPDDVLSITRKRPVRIGRRRLTTPIPSTDIPMVIPKKLNQEDNQNNFGDTEKPVEQPVTLSIINQDKVETNNETSVKPENFVRFRNFTQNIPVASYRRSSSPITTTTTISSVTSSPTRASYRKSSRYQANASRKVEAISTETTTQRVRRPIIRSTEKTQIDSTTPLPPPLSRGTVRSSNKNLAKLKPDELDDLEDENYPEHFKMLLKANYNSNLSTAAPDKVTKFQNFKSRRVLPYRGYKQNSSTSTTPSTPSEPTFKSNVPRVNQYDKRSKNVSFESNDVYVKDLDSTKENFDLVKETNYPEGTTTSGRFSSQIQPKEKLYEVTTFKPALSKLLARNKLFKQRGQTVDSDLNIPQSPPNQPPVTIREIPPSSLHRYSARYKSDNNFKSNSGSKSGASSPFYIPTIPPRTTDADSITTQYIYNEVEPVHSGLMHSPIGVETSHHSSSVTVSIFGALSEVLSQTTESLSFLTSSTTDPAQSTSTQPPPTTTTTTTTTTTQAPTTTTKFTTSTTEQVQEMSTESTSVQNSIEIHVNNIQNYPTANQFDEITSSENEIPTRSARLIDSDTLNDPNIPTASPNPHVLKTKLTDTTDALKNHTKIAQLTSPITTVSNYVLTHASPLLTQLVSLTDSSTKPTIVITPSYSTDSDVIKTTTLKSGEFSTIKGNTNFSNEDNSAKENATTTITPLYTRQRTQDDDITKTKITFNTHQNTTTPKTDLHSILQQPIPTSLTNLSTIQDFSNLRSRLVTSLAETNQQRPVYVMPTSSNSQKATVSMFTLPMLETTTPLPRLFSSSTSRQLATSTILTTSSSTTTVTPIPLLTTTKLSTSTSRPSTTESSSPILLSARSTKTVSSTTSPAPTAQLYTTMNPPTILLSTTEIPPDYVPRFSKRIPILPVRPPKRDYVVYGILPNNTVVKKIIDENTTENPLIIYGILPNNTVVRKYPNGTIVSGDHNNKLEITDIDPKSLTDPNSDFYQHIHKETVPNDTNTMPLYEMEIFTTMAPSTYSTARNLNATDFASTTITSTSVNSTTAMTASSIIDLLKTYNQTDTQLKTQNIFSLAPTSPAQINNMREKYLTLDIDPVTNQVRDPTDLDNLDNLDGSVYRWNPVSSTSETTTETSRGVEIIKNLVEQAKTTEDVPTGAIQSLTTSRNKEAGRGFAIVTTAQTATSTKEIKTNVPYNIKSNSNIRANDENIVVERTITIAPSVPSTEKTNIHIPPTDTTPSQTRSTRKTTTTTSTTAATTTVTTTTPNPTKSPNSFRRSTTTNHPITSTNPSTPFQDQSTLQRNLLLLQELLGLTEDGARGLNQGNSLRASTVLMRRPTTVSPTSTTVPTTTSTSTTTTTTTTPKPTTTSTMRTTTTTFEIPTERQSVKFNSIDDILNSLQTAKPTTRRPRTTTTATPEVDDLTFINRLRFLLNPSLTTRKPPTRATTTTTTSTTTPKPTRPTTLPSNINDLFASFPELTTKKQTTFSDSDDIAFLAGLREIAQLDQPKQSAVQDPDFANKIIQLAINRTGKSTSSNKLPSDEQTLTNNNAVHPNSIQIESTEVKPTLSKSEIERGKQDIETINSDLSLLSTLLGRPISPNDLPQLTQQFGGGAASSEGPKKRYPSSTSTTSTTTTQPAIIKEVELLQSLLKSPNKDIKSQVGSDEYYGNTDEAILATILKQKGIGPSHNNIPIEQLLGQNNNYYQTPRITTTTPRPRPPVRQARPILDGLSWLWRTWQDTAPGPKPTKPRAQNPREIASSNQQLVDDGTDGDTYTKPLDSSESDESYSPLAPAGGGLLSAAIGVTRAVTQFLGAALQGAGRSIQSAWSSQTPSGSSADNNYFRLSG